MFSIAVVFAAQSLPKLRAKCSYTEFNRVLWFAREQERTLLAHIHGAVSLMNFLSRSRAISTYISHLSCKKVWPARLGTPATLRASEGYARRL
jgi:hypothetical protein